MGQVGEHLASSVLGTLQPLSHGVERSGQGVHFRPGAHGRDPGVVAAAGHPFGRLGQLPQRGLDAAGEPDGGQQRTDQGGGQGHGQSDQVGVAVGPLHVQQFRRALGVPGHDEVIVEQRWADQGGHHDRGHEAGAHHQQLGAQKPRGQPAFAPGAHRATIR